MKRVLIVDDIPDNILLLSYDLEDDDFHVIKALNGEECLRLASIDPQPDIILLDINMPGLSGVETLTRLKNDPNTADIPVIMVSASDIDDVIVETIDLGAHDFVTNPIEYRVLAARMRSALRLTEALADLEKANLELNTLATTDPLTGAYNRRQFFALADIENAKKERHNKPMSVMMLDIDKFKQLNDKLGHAGGDYALQEVTKSLNAVCRSYDIIGRIGGEEFAICSPHADLDGAYILAERIRSTCEGLPLRYNEHTFSLTLSIGLTDVDYGEDFESALQRADDLLYQAKNSGKNKIVTSGKKPQLRTR